MHVLEADHNLDATVLSRKIDVWISDKIQPGYSGKDAVEPDNGALPRVNVKPLADTLYL